MNLKLKLNLSEDNISFYDEVVFEFLFHLFVLCFFFRCEFKRDEYIVCLLTHGVNQCVYLVLAALLVQSRCLTKSFNSLYPFRPTWAKIGVEGWDGVSDPNARTQTLTVILTLTLTSRACQFSK